MTASANNLGRLQLSSTPVIESTPLEALGLDEMPIEYHFRRNHFDVPAVEAGTWSLSVTDARNEVLNASLSDLQHLPSTSLAVVLVCAGNRREEFHPAAQGVQWDTGAISEALWTGARLCDLLESVDLGRSTHLILEGADSGPIADRSDEPSFARAIPLEKALDRNTLIAWGMNDQPIPVEYGGPVRAIVPGWYATDSVKWLTAVRLQSGEFDGYFEAEDYRLPDATGAGTRRMTELPPNSLLTSLPDNASIAAGQTELRGIAWSAAGIAGVALSIDESSWLQSFVSKARSRYSRTFWNLPWLAQPGTHSVRVRATDWNGASQPDLPNWNPHGYNNNSTQRVTIHVSEAQA